MNAPRYGLDPAVIEHWHRVNGPDGGLGPNRSRLARSGGRGGTAPYAEFVILEAENPDDFEQLLYWRPLSKIVAYSLLQTAVRTRRTSDQIRDHPSDFLIVAVQTLGGTTGRANGHEFRSGPGRLTITDSRLPYDLTTHGVSDSAGIWVPTEVLGGDIAAGATVPPTVPDTPLTRSCASLVSCLARDVAVGGADVDLDTELAAIEVVRAVLDQSEEPDRRPGDDPDVLRAVIVDLVDRNFRDPAFGATTLARHLHVSKRQLYRNLEELDMSLSEMLNERRLELARTLLAGPERVRLEGIARSAGFPSVATLRNRFRARYGVTPDDYRRVAEEDDVPEDRHVGSEA
ncbi:AraC family transcriptional regulator [Gordonia sp. ABSL49_1]|uniref:AraC family transcriptional regulator n=1 Tax=Gordonia sp. ABSL49_1 TaxID=2920941 RepID=UPI001F0EEDB9|nr:AraC family transcriptional regulator [Gordonia sp. ABSL49_1]MCH5641724.1 AraC family transcriptional regulator [Gordonia sp. ABSL49_1]